MQGLRLKLETNRLTWDFSVLNWCPVISRFPLSNYIIEKVNWLQRCTMTYEAKTTCFIQDHAQTGKQNKEPKCYSLGSYKQICLARKRH